MSKFHTLATNGFYLKSTDAATVQALAEGLYQLTGKAPELTEDVAGVVDGFELDDVTVRWLWWALRWLGEQGWEPVGSGGAVGSYIMRRADPQ